MDQALFYAAALVAVVSALVVIGQKNPIYSAFALIQMAEYVNMITVTVLATSLFLGGWHSGIPGVPSEGLLGFVFWGAKVAFLLFVFIWLRGTLPRFRYDQLMHFGWKVLIPVAAVWIFVTAAGVALAGW